MKKFFKNLILFSIPLFVAGLFFAQTIKFDALNESYVEAETPTKIETINNLKSVSGAGNYVLGNSLGSENDSISNWSPLGSQENPFRGVFDGAGKSIIISTIKQGQYSGIFGYTNGATIKNLRVKIIGSNLFSESESPESELYYGVIAGVAENTTISNCEVEIESGQKIVISSNYRSNCGTICGQMKGNSKIENCANYADMEVKVNMGNHFTLKIGGIVGSLDQSTANNVLNYGSLTVTEEEETQKANLIAVGGILGEISGDVSKIYNAVNIGRVNCPKGIALEEENQEKNYQGGIIGSVNSLPNSGNVASSAYVNHFDGSGEPILGDAIGNANGYAYVNSQTKDYVVRIFKTATLDSKFYFCGSEGYLYETEDITRTFKWYSLSNGWDKDLWLMNSLSDDNQLKLQQFESFLVGFATPVDNVGILTILQDSNEQKAYGETVTLKASFVDPNNAKFYDIVAVNLNGEECDEDVVQILDAKTEVQTKDICCYKTFDENDSVTGYVIDVVAGSLTAGVYSFKLEAKSFNGYLGVYEGEGSVRFGENAGGVNVKREFTKESIQTVIQADPGTLYSFKQWNLYYKYNGDAQNADIVATSGNWKKQGTIRISSGGNDVDVGAKLAIKFGEKLESFVEIGGEKNDAYLDQDFLIMAVFNQDYYRMKFVVDEDKKAHVTNLKINDENGFDFVNLGKNSVVKVYVELEKDYQLDEDLLFSIIQEDDAPLITVKYLKETDENGYYLNTYTITFSTSKLSASKKDGNYVDYPTFIFKMPLKQVVEELSPYTFWTILGISVGGGVLALIVAVVILRKSLRRRRRMLRSIKNTTTPSEILPMPKEKKINPKDYKNFY